MKFIVLGGGAQGRVIAADLAASMPSAEVRIADVAEPPQEVPEGVEWLRADLSEPESVARILYEHDLGVGALPSRFGFGAMQAAIEARTPLVDVSFSAEDPLALDRAARAAGVAIVPDCGLAPGLSNLISGRAVAERGAPRSLMIMVGGVAQDPSLPYGYVATWSLDDLLEEYTRPARIVRDGAPIDVPVFSDLEHVHVDGVGEMEAFYSDGLRSLLTTLPGVRQMGEKTLRWPGHAEAVKPLVASNRLVEELRAHCTHDPPLDLVALVVRLRWARAETVYTLVDRYDPASGRTAMSRTTALTTSVVAQLGAAGGLDRPGVHPLELLAREPGAYAFVTEAMAARGIRIAQAVPSTPA